MEVRHLGSNAQIAFETPNKIILDLDLVNYLENSVSSSQYGETILFVVGVSVLHEAVHYGDFTYNNNYWQGRNDCLDGEEGWLFEESVYGTNVGILTDGTIYFFDRCD
ncbi:hypothetical protein [Maribacter sp. MAR_2009_72]|uniref:hypothetical protein n=1 Tax=Maribacter sp. MAR_2009_72 TaxID=1250050 RepID=UPI001199F72F|nr:hypothetical protein [Maribacter sp. MAR_2009_72]TVZ16486.1 zincin-like metallopeptidase toxin 3 of polymorphic toxin system [Maribacter sp. MAR_2009_72]